MHRSITGCKDRNNCTHNSGSAWWNLNVHGVENSLLVYCLIRAIQKDMKNWIAEVMQCRSVLYCCPCPGNGCCEGIGTDPDPTAGDGGATIGAIVGIIALPEAPGADASSWHRSPV